MSFRLNKQALPTCIRSVANYGAAIYSTHAAPSVRARLEAEQHKSVRVSTGYIRLNNSGTLTTDAELPAYHHSQ